MRKYIKWILLLILIICLVIFGFKLVDFNNNINNVDNVSKNGYEINLENFYEFVWKNRGISYYDSDGELVKTTDKAIDNHYMLFSKEEIMYCNQLDDKCNNYPYNYDGHTLIIGAEDDFIYEGIYDVKFENDVLELIKTIDGTKTIYYFQYLLG